MADRSIEIVYDHFANRGTVEKLTDLPAWIQRAQEEERELFRSYYCFDESAQQYAREHGTLVGWSGVVSIDRLLLDIDRSDKTDDQAIAIVRTYCEQLQAQFQLNKEEIFVYFSGTGYHIVFPDVFGFAPGPMLPRVVRATLLKHFPEADDIYDMLRIIRVENTKNKKSDLWKTRLSFEEVHTLLPSEIMDKSREVNHHGFDVIPDPRQTFPQLIVTKIVTHHTGNQRPGQPQTPQQTSPVAGLAATAFASCIQHLYVRGPVQGRRHKDVLRIASGFRRGGIPQEATRLVLDQWMESSPLKPGELDRLVDDTYRVPYQFGCDDAVMAEFCDPQCVFFKRKNFGQKINTISDGIVAYQQMLAHQRAGTVIDFGCVFEGIGPFLCYPGEFIIILGDTGIGKSTFIQNLVVGTPHFRVAYFNLEMGIGLLTRRFIQIAKGWNKDDVESEINSANDTLPTLGLRAFPELDHLRIIQHHPDIRDLEKDIAATGCQVIVFDTMDGIETGLEETEATRRISVMLQEIAAKYGLIIIAIHHISKADAKLGVLTAHSGKGSSALEQKADKVLIIEGNSAAQLRIIRSAKARDERPFNVHVRFDVNTFQFKPFSGGTQLKVGSVAQAPPNKPFQWTPEEKKQLGIFPPGDEL